MVHTLERRLQEVKNEETEILKNIDERNKRKRIECGSCDNSHQIQKLTLIQTHWYTSPRGCIGGDYWNEGEMQFICPETNVINRIKLSNFDVPYEKREEFKNNPEDQFKMHYKRLFKEVINGHKYTGGVEYSKNGENLKSEEVTNGSFVNNYHINQNRKKFGLVEKRN